MRSAVVYELRYGDTARIAQAIATSLEAAGPVRLVEAAKENSFDVEGIDLLVVGGPTEGHGVSPTLRAILAKVRPDSLEGVAAAAFDTRFRWTVLLSGSAARGIAKTLEAKGARLVAPPESFFVRPSYGPLLEGEIARAAAWAKQIASDFAAASPPAA